MNTLSNKKVLITCGPTSCPIDDTRMISNISTGALGHMIARKLMRSSARVTLLEGPVSDPFKSKKAAIKKFYTYDEFAKLVKEELKNNYDIIIHAAAVSDYKLIHPFSSKLSSQKKSLVLKLVPTRKIINSIKKTCPKVFLVGFKLDSRINNEENAREIAGTLFAKAKCDLVVANSLKNNHYTAFILDKENILEHQTSREALAKSLINQLKKSL